MGQIRYDNLKDRLVLTVEEPSLVDETYWHSYCEGRVDLQFVVNSGGILALKLNKVSDIFEGLNENGQIRYDEDCDTLTIGLVTSDEQLTFGADCIHMDERDHSMITLNRNGVGNLVGIEIVAVSSILNKYS
tara:strand:+ start:126 stop:521 length:396 start_codon:yes stop_codon:yes gene_type:complete